MKLVSLLPSSTEIAFLLGLDQEVAAVTHECDYPPAAAGKPVITRSAIDHDGASSQEIDHAIRSELHAGRSIYHIDQDLLAEINPDLILTQELCDVCAVSYTEVTQACKLLGGKRRILSLEPNSLDGILDTILQVGEVTGQEQRAIAEVSILRARIDRVRDRAAALARPRVYCMEWLDPPFAAGHWVPELVSLAGGTEGLGRLHTDSVQMDWAEVCAYDPEVLVLMPCGFDVARVLAELPLVQSWPGWSELSAVRNGRVWAVNGSAYYNRPGPRIVTGLEILAHILHPEQFPDVPEAKGALRAT